MATPFIPDLSNIHEADTPRFGITFLDETGVAVNISAGTKTIRFQKPDGTTFDRTMSGVTNTLARYQCTTADLIGVGWWKLQFKYVENQLEYKTASIDFQVKANLPTP